MEVHGTEVPCPITKYLLILLFELKELILATH